MKIGVGVEGPSDRAFWSKVLHKHFRSVQFDIRNMKSREKLIRETSRLLDSFRGLGYGAAFILVDRDKSPCVSSVLDEFENHVREEARKASSSRYLFVCVAVRELEAWFLADPMAVNVVLPNCGYTAPAETGEAGAATVLVRLWRAQYGQAAFNKIEFANSMAPKFAPDQACQHSTSFAYFWNQLRSRVASQHRLP